MSEFIREAWAKLTLRFSPSRRRWLLHYGHYYPVLRDAFGRRASALVLVLRTLDDIDSARLAQAKQKLERIGRMAAFTSRQEDNVLHAVLAGMYHLRRDDTHEMGRWFRRANKLGHSFHLLHMLLAVHYIHDRWMFDRAYQELDRGIDCMYAHGALDEKKRRVIAVMHSLMALCRMMMHRFDEAERLMGMAQPAEDTAEYQFALATLRAVQGREAEAGKAMAALKETDPARHTYWQESVRLMLAGTHPHFTAKEPDREAIAAYWAWFAENEKELRRALEQQGPNTCHAMQREAFRQLVPEPANVDMMGHDFVLVDGKPEIHFYALHSRNYQALIDALVAACPQEVTRRWRLRAYPGDPWGTAQETIEHYEQKQETEEHAG